MGFPITRAEHEHSEALISAGPELIVSAAIQVDWYGSKLVVMAERPGRHGNCIGAAGRLSGDLLRGGAHGFLTNRGRFVDRKEAGEIAAAAGQATVRANCNDHLFSEDVWLDHDEPRHIDPAEIF